MSYIRATERPKWEEHAFERGLYVYSDGSGVCHMPREHRAFVEVVMRMLEQSDKLTDSELTKAHAALRTRLNIERGSAGKVTE